MQAIIWPILALSLWMRNTGEKMEVFAVRLMPVPQRFRYIKAVWTDRGDSWARVAAAVRKELV